MTSLNPSSFLRKQESICVVAMDSDSEVGMTAKLSTFFMFRCGLIAMDVDIDWIPLTQGPAEKTTWILNWRIL